MLRKNAQFPIMSEDLKQLNKDLRTLNKYHKYMMDPVYKRFISSQYYSLLRFLVVCRQSIKVNQILYEVAFIMHKSENTINHLQNKLRTLIRKLIETLINTHEQH